MVFLDFGKKEWKGSWRKCDWCGRFVSYENLQSGESYHVMVTPDSHYSSETWETCCKKCKRIKYGK